MSEEEQRIAMLEKTVAALWKCCDADLTGCRVYGVSAWDLKLERIEQQNLIITPENEPAITVDNIEVAQFIYQSRGKPPLFLATCLRKPA
jgi:hypothetical protein